MWGDIHGQRPNYVYVSHHHNTMLEEVGLRVGFDGTMRNT